MSPASNVTDLERWYTGYLIVHGLTDHLSRKVAELGNEVPFFEFTGAALEIEYRGRDTSRVVVKALLRLAQLVRDADGEVQCQVSGDADQLWFEYYWITNGQLFQQRADVVRRTAHEVSEAMLKE